MSKFTLLRALATASIPFAFALSGCDSGPAQSIHVTMPSIEPNKSGLPSLGTGGGPKAESATGSNEPHLWFGIPFRCEGPADFPYRPTWCTAR